MTAMEQGVADKPVPGAVRLLGLALAMAAGFFSIYLAVRLAVGLLLKLIGD